MTCKLPSKSVVMNGYNNKRRRQRKPWWTEDLTDL